ncbi:NAD-dependent epimerase/dehydratase family protein [Streptomyces sp. CA-294286]|uniref:NAD-dependent epimerase/dehydratase family protein n=1 Tax=Streptomyces sp. CA-294286 TaxID=3240070 RepID=UPI003D8B3E8F
MRATVIGATGFIGGAVVDQLLRLGVEVRAVGRHAPAVEERAGVEWVEADLAEPPSLRGLCKGSDVLLQLASYIGSDPARCHRVNTLGTREVVREAERSGIRRTVLLSTAAAYGAGVHRGIAVEQVEPGPLSVASASRRAAEQSVLDAHGVVLRPGLVVGAGDRWVVPALADALHRVPARWGGGQALHSVISVHDLARLIAGITVVQPAPETEGRIFHANHPRPVPIADLISSLAARGLVVDPTEDWPLDRCLAALGERPGWVSERQFRLLAEDHWYLSEEVWNAFGVAPAPDPLSWLTDAADWYRRHLAETDRHSAQPHCSG